MLLIDLVKLRSALAEFGTLCLTMKDTPYGNQDSMFTLGVITSA